jgi:NADPH2:quinone reductase
MSPTIPKTMKAAVIDRFGGPAVLHVAKVPVPEPGEREILVRVDTAGIGVWDPWLREGGMGGSLPLVLGSDGSGTVVACGSKVRRFKVGDRVYGYAFGNPKGGFYAQYAAISDGAAAPVPADISMKEAGALMASALTALAGLDQLKVKKGQTLLILGASGGVGHVALQLAKRLGARLLAIASRRDGVKLVKRLGADEAVDGRAANFGRKVEDLAPGGFDAAMAFANSESLMEVLKQVKKGGTIAYPNGVEPEPKGPAGVKVYAFDGVPTAGAYERLDGLIAQGPFRVEVSRTYRLEEAAQAHRDVLKHHIGKLAFKIRG